MLKKLFDMANRKEICEVEFDFIYDIQDVLSDCYTDDVILFNENHLNQIRGKWNHVADALRHAMPVNSKTLFIAVSDTATIQGNTFEAKGCLQDKEGQPCSCYRIMMLDDDLIEDDNICSTITDQNGLFSVSFDSSTFRDSVLDRKDQPDYIFKIFRWRSNQFEFLKEIRPIPLKVESIGNDSFGVDFGIIQI